MGVSAAGRGAGTALHKTLTTVEYFTFGFGTMVGVGWLVVMDDWLGRGGPARPPPGLHVRRPPLLARHATHRTPRRAHPRLGRGLDPVGEGVEAVGRRHAPGGASGGPAGRDRGGRDATLLTRTESDGLAVPHQDDGIRHDVRDDPPG